MKQVTIGSKNQVVIPLEVRKKIPELKPGRQVCVYALDDKTIALTVPPKSWLDSSYGLMKNSWPADAAHQFDKLRSEWREI
ncbi:MAG: hypothetical protein COU69_01395 [Candidatus Pacebacteria bacterium CG10_big_fil_rev_8_21_14_0_10_56_10]|nr:MAG: hypothetical protein COU69_01395 [Candidatus Pacebacteria bacterium CG10_big_fil_rev_8_21_14_0_10_56_10]